MKKEDFIDFLRRSSPEEIFDLLMKKGKRKKISPIIQYTEEDDIDDILSKIVKEE